MRYQHDGMILWFATPDAPAPIGVVPPLGEPTITVAVQPIDASNRVEVRLRRGGRSEFQVVPARWLWNDSHAGVQYFRACLPACREGERVEYTVVAACAGRQVPSPETARDAVANFQIASPMPERMFSAAPAPCVGLQPFAAAQSAGGPLSRMALGPRSSLSPYLLVLHQGIARNGELWSIALQDQAWKEDAQTSKTGMSASPSAVVFNGKVFCLHQGASQNSQLWWNVYDGAGWEGDARVPGKITMSNSPSAVEFNGKLYCFHQGAWHNNNQQTPNGELWLTVFDGNRWYDDAQVPDTGMSISPSAVVFNGKLFCFHQGASQNGQLWYNVFDGTKWLRDTRVPQIRGMSEAPSAVVFKGLLHCFYQGPGQNGRLMYTVFDGAHWLGEWPMPGNEVCMSKSPSAVVDGAGNLYCFYQGPGENGQLKYNVFNGAAWLGERDVSDTGMSESPCAISTQLAPPPDYDVTVDPSEVRVQAFDGWGCSLCWWANQYGGTGGAFGAAFLADVLFGTAYVTDSSNESLPGLGMNIVRYNIGGGGGGATIDGAAEVISPDNPVGSPRYIRGFWKKPGPGDENTDDPTYWDWTADQNQVLMLERAHDRGANIFEFFSNSPMWWMCDNYSSSGGDSYLSSNLQSWNVDQFARYLVTVTKYAGDHWGINPDYIEPFNEPWWDFLGVGAYGPWVFPKNQEGCNFPPGDPYSPGASQVNVINSLYRELSNAGLQDGVMIAAPDSNKVDEAITTLTPVYPLSRIAKVNVHGYYGQDPYRGSGRPTLRDMVRKAGKKLWMSEYGDGKRTGMTMATSILLDMTQLQPDAWIYWQPIDPGSGWSFFKDGSNGEVVGPALAKYFVFAQFSRHITQGCRIIGNSDPNSVVAYNPSARKLVIVTLSGDPTRERRTFYDLSTLRNVSGPLRGWGTTVVDGQAVKKYEEISAELRSKKFRFDLDPYSVCTFEIDNVDLV